MGEHDQRQPVAWVKADIDRVVDELSRAVRIGGVGLSDIAGEQRIIENPAAKQPFRRAQLKDRQRNRPTANRQRVLHIHHSIRIGGAVSIRSRAVRSSAVRSRAVRSRAFSSTNLHERRVRIRRRHIADLFAHFDVLRRDPHHDRRLARETLELLLVLEVHEAKQPLVGLRFLGVARDQAIRPPLPAITRDLDQRDRIERRTRPAIGHSAAWDRVTQVTSGAKHYIFERIVGGSRPNGDIDRIDR